MKLNEKHWVDHIYKTLILTRLGTIYEDKFSCSLPTSVELRAMLVTLASGLGVPILVGARVGQKLPVSIHTATSGWDVGAERVGCVVIPRLTEIEPWSLS